MIITPTEVSVIEDRRQERLAATARARLITAATQPAPATTSQKVGRIRASLREAVASLVALAPIG
jgi:hypothetical protein